MKKYIIKNHLGIIAIFISIFVPVISIFIQHDIEQKRTTKTYYFAGSYDNLQQNSPVKEIDCWTRSAISNRSDAFRCMVNSMIHDPCFVDPFNRNIVVCPIDSAGNNESFKVNLKEEVENEPLSKGENIPWLIKLYNGNECRFVSGVSLMFADMRMDYVCEEGGETDNFLLLPFLREDHLIKIGCMINGKIDQCEVKETWY